MNKQFLSASVKGPNIDSDQDIGLSYLLNSGVTYTSLISSGTNTNTPNTANFAAGTTGYAIQPQLTFNGFTDLNGQFPRITSLEIRYRDLPTTKDEYIATLSLPAGPRDFADVMLSNLETALHASAVTLIDPVRRSVTVNVMDMRVLELYQSESGYPALAVELRMVEL